jgi:hypothetical protein
MQRSFQFKSHALTEKLREQMKVKVTTSTERLPTFSNPLSINLEVVNGEQRCKTTVSAAQSSILYSSCATPAIFRCQGSSKYEPGDDGDVPVTAWP